jgi:hypothetical protein
MSELLPGGILCEETSATVHPQDELILPIVRVESPLFFSVNEWVTFFPWATVPKSKTGWLTVA